jgi:hypothetical protein
VFLRGQAPGRLRREVPGLALLSSFGVPAAPPQRWLAGLAAATTGVAEAAELARPVPGPGLVSPVPAWHAERGAAAPEAAAPAAASAAALLPAAAGAAGAAMQAGAAPGAAVLWKDQAAARGARRWPGPAPAAAALQGARVVEGAGSQGGEAQEARAGMRGGAAATRMGLGPGPGLAAKAAALLEPAVEGRAAPGTAVRSVLAGPLLLLLLLGPAGALAQAQALAQALAQAQASVAPRVAGASWPEGAAAAALPRAAAAPGIARDGKPRGECSAPLGEGRRQQQEGRRCGRVVSTGRLQGTGQGTASLIVAAQPSALRNPSCSKAYSSNEQRHVFDENGVHASLKRNVKGTLNHPLH